MALKDLIIKDEKIDEIIKSLEEKKEHLNVIIESVLKEVIKEKFPTESFTDVYRKNPGAIEAIEESLRQEYLQQIESRIQRLYCLKEERDKQ